MNEISNICASCIASHNVGEIKKQGINIDKYDYVIALAGNPNTGKSTVFNALTGLKQHTGNWPGKTVARAEGAFSYDEKKYKIIDLPGTYSLMSTSEDEEIARNFILFGQPNITIVVVDATRLERNLNLVLQVLEVTEKVVLCLNLMDEARRNKVRVDSRALSRRLGIPVVETSARRNEGIKELIAVINDVVTGKYICKPHRIENISKELNVKIESLTQQLKEIYPEMSNHRWLAIRMLQGDKQVIDAIKSGVFIND